MNNLRISYLNSKLSRSNSSLTAISVVSPYSRNTPNIQLKSDLKKQSSSVERPKSSKMSYSGATTRGHTPINRDVTDRKHSPHAERKSDLLLSSLYQLAKQKPKEKSGSAKIYKTKDVQAKKTPKASSRPGEKMPDKSAIYQYLQNKGSRKLEESKVLNPSSMMNTPSRQASRSHLHDGEFNFEKKMIEGRLFKQQQLIEALEEMHRMKNKSSISHSSSNGGPYMKSNQRSSQIKTGRTTPVSSQQLNVASILEKKKTMEPKKNELFKDLKLENDHYYAQKEKATPQTHNQPQPIMVLEGELMPKRHKRGLSTGQNPLCIDPFLLEQQRDREIQMELEREREREKEREKEMIKQQQLQMQMQMQMEQQYKDPQQQEDEFFEEFFHMDKMTFDFEKLMISRKNEQQQLKQKQLQAQFFTPAASPLQKKPLMHSRTKSIEEVNSVLPTKSSSRWTTKRSSKGDEFPQHGREHFNLIEHISDFDKTENDREDIRRYYKGY